MCPTSSNFYHCISFKVIGKYLEVEFLENSKKVIAMIKESIYKGMQVDKKQTKQRAFS